MESKYKIHNTLPKADISEGVQRVPKPEKICQTIDKKYKSENCPKIFGKKHQFGKIISAGPWDSEK